LSRRRCHSRQQPRSRSSDQVCRCQARTDSAVLNHFRWECRRRHNPASPRSSMPVYLRLLVHWCNCKDQTDPYHYYVPLHSSHRRCHSPQQPRSRWSDQVCRYQVRTGSVAECRYRSGCRHRRSPVVTIPRTQGSRPSAHSCNHMDRSGRYRCWCSKPFVSPSLSQSAAAQIALVGSGVPVPGSARIQMAECRYRSVVPSPSQSSCDHTAYAGLEAVGAFV
jgi:hypothetical protein